MPPIQAKAAMPTRPCASLPNTPRRRTNAGECLRLFARASACFASSTTISPSERSRRVKSNPRESNMEAIFVGTLDGVFKVARTAGGVWNTTSQELCGMEVDVLASYPRRRETIYAGIRGGGLFRKDNAGMSWH